MMPRQAVRAALHLAAIIALTIVTQIGGACYIVGLAVAARRGVWRGIGVAVLLYGALAAVVLPLTAPFWGRAALSCGAGSALYCALNRHYGTPELAAVVGRVGAELQRRHPGSVVSILDAGFPLPLPMPLLPHLSHRDGRAVDLALFYEGRARAGAWPLGYFAFAPAAAAESVVCERPGSLRWSLDWLQPLFDGLMLDHERTADLVRIAVADPAVRRALLHPDLSRRLGIRSDKLRFAGCHAARHDDHLHIEVGSAP